MPKNEKVNVLSTLINYHEGIGEFIHLYSDLKTKKSSTVLDELVKFINTKLIGHFLLEEMVVFPSIHAKIPAKRFIIDKYLKEHKEILSELCRIIYNETDDVTTAIDMVLRKLMGHALDEDKHIVEQVRTHSHLTLVMGRAYLINERKLLEAQKEGLKRPDIISHHQPAAAPPEPRDTHAAPANI